MKYLIAILIYGLSLHSITAQSFSRVIDLDTVAKHNHHKDFKSLSFEDKLYWVATKFCDRDSIFIECTEIVKLDTNGGILSSIQLDTVYSLNGGPDRLEISQKGKLYYSTHGMQAGFKNTLLITINQDLIVQNIDAFDGPEGGSSIDNEGIISIDSFRYLYGNVHNSISIPDSAQVVKIDGEGQSVWENHYTEGDADLDINSLQPTPDGNLAFILYHEPASGIGGLHPGRKIIKINPQGDYQNSFYFKDIWQQENRLLVSNDGNYYVPSNINPSDFYDISEGQLNKINANLETLDWSYKFPNDPLTNGHMYRVTDLTETSNGDIIVCGRVWDNSDSEILGPDIHSTWNGFLLRITPSGELVWLRIFKYPNDLLPPNNEYGKYRPSVFNKVIQLENGKFIVAGEISVSSQQFYSLDEDVESIHLWLLKLNENGCLDDYPCKKIIKLNNPNNYTKIDLDASWTFETEEYIGGGNGIIDFETLKVIDSIRSGGRTIYYLNNGDSLYVSGNQVYFWDRGLNSYEMHFDFDRTTDYQIRYWDLSTIPGKERKATVHIDSVTNKILDSDTIKVQHIRISNSGTVVGDMYVNVYEGIGASHSDVKFNLGELLADSDTRTTALRCFYNDTISYNFVDYACDSTGVYSDITELDDYNIKIFPNPTHEIIRIQNIDKETKYQIYSIHGELLDSGTTNNHTINIEQNGILILKLYIDEHWITIKVLKIPEFKN